LRKLLKLKRKLLLRKRRSPHTQAKRRRDAEVM
jgi:hypothetical protein